MAEEEQARVSPQLSKAQRDWLKAGAKLPELFTLRKGYSTVVFRIIGRRADGVVPESGSRMGMKGFVLKVQDPEDDTVYAAKFCVAEDYDGPRTELSEARLASKLRPAGRLFAVPIHHGRVERFEGMPGTQTEFVCFISEWIDGQTLEGWCRQRKESLTGEFIIRVAKDVSTAITYLSRKDLKHDDLHWGNVMIRPPEPDLIVTAGGENEYSVCIIDLGSLKPYEQTTNKSKDDHLSMVQILHQLYNAAWQSRRLVAASPQFFTAFQAVLVALLDEDPLRHFPRPEHLSDALNKVEATLNTDASLEPRAFEPFEGISAEHLADDETLLALFNDSLPWFRDILEAKPVVLMGPRGCGKSMLFRYMSAPTQAKAVGRSKAEMLKGFGVYVSCATHLQNNLVWIAREEGRAKTLAHPIATYFQLVVVRELMRAISQVYRDSASRKRFDLREPVLDKWVQWIDHQFPEPIETPRLPEETRAAHFIEDLDRARLQVHKDMLRGTANSLILSDGFLGSVTEKLAELNPVFQREPIIFLLDDYTESRLHKDIQATVNRIVFERRASHYFKISCERMGFDARDSDGIKIDSAREYHETDAGQHAVEDCKPRDAEAFLTALIDQRLEKAGWKGRCSTLIGSSSPYDDDRKLAGYIREEASRQGRRFYYFGTAHLARLWSGDIATTLQIVKDMCIQANVQPHTVTRISNADQHSSIVAISKAYRSRIKDLHPLGLQLSRILDAFGVMARTVLVEGLLNAQKEPRRLYRLEMTLPKTEPFVSQLEQLNKDVGPIAKELLRRSVFHPLRESRGKEGPATTTIRWEMRNIFRPAFGLSLEKSESYLDIKAMDQMVELLLQPAAYLEKRTLSYTMGRKQDRSTGSLFGEGELS